MAEDKTNGSDPQWAPPRRAPMTAPRRTLIANQLVINAQYLKDLSFENPRAPQSLIQGAEPPDVTLDADVKGRNIAPDMGEVMLTISAQAKTKTDISLRWSRSATARW